MSQGFSRSQKSTPISHRQAPIDLPPRGFLILMLALTGWVGLIGVFALVGQFLAVLF
ncbi:hypothetical protein [Devosia beringensis]|uniref:hypothetical protein n=1 Tax=Devosia beringensis TaxID=2657486 RepID=UPI00186B5B67|nr:hypothetical protein [Devosia beringensis]